MIHQPEYVKALLKKYIEGVASPQEVARLMAAWDIYDDEELSEMIAEVTIDFKDADIEGKKWELPVEASFKYSIKPSQSTEKNSTVSSQFKHAAIFIVGIAAACLLLRVLDRPQQLLYSCGGIHGNTELPTGRYTCRLVLANNCSILIDSTYKGTITQQGNVEIVQPYPGMIKYKASDTLPDEEPALVYNIIETSKGQQYQLILPDGTKVRLNAASSIRFPVTFSHHKRIVHLTGEALFDVVPNRAVPFYVITNNAEIKVLGTTFNVDAYSKNTTTTLLTGSLEIKSSGETARIIPGEKAISWHSTKLAKDTIIVTKGDTLQTISWKNVNRIYSNTPLREFVSDMGRWYELEIVNLGCVPANAVISVSLCYDAPIEDVLHIFNKTRLRYFKAGNKVTFCNPAPK